ncbi:MAG: hypothetical protein KKE65_06815, partial [Actinobacteria bacterium]|nr:hypothetical protein [Actinomycetota bacterium]
MSRLPHHHRPVSHRSRGLAALAVLALTASTGPGTTPSAGAATGPAALTVSPATTAGPAAAPAARRAGTGNLIRNGSAEKTKGEPDDFSRVAIKGWSVKKSEQFTAARYAPEAPDPQAYGLRLSKNSPGPAGRGKNHFTGAYHTSSADTGRATQRIDLSRHRSLIRKGAQFDLRGWLGGYAGNEDRMQVTLTWLDRKGKKVGKFARLAPVTLADRDILTPDEPGDEVTLLAERTASGTVPK